MAVAAYNLKREARVYVVDSTETNQYQLDISAISFSQATREDSISQKNLFTTEYFEASKITKVNPANFSFTLPALREDDLKVVFDRLLDYQTFDLYIATEREVFKLDTAVITNGSFIIERSRPLSLNISGEASQLSLVGDIDSVTIPGSLQTRSSTRTYNRISYLSASLGGTSITLDSGINSASIIIRNNIKWVPNDTVGLCSSNSLQYPEAFVLQSREFSGNIVQYISDVTGDIASYSNDTTFALEVGEKIGATVYGFNIAVDNCAYTSKVTTGEVFTQVFDWRMVQNPSSLSDVITYVTV